MPATAGDMSEDEGGCEYFPDTGATSTPITIPTTRIKGVNPCWKREYLEDAVWAVMEWQTREAGKAIELEMMDFIIATYLTDFGQSITGDHDHLDFEDFTDALAEAEGADSHPDTLLCHPKDYANLLKDPEFVSSLYVGDDSVMRSGIVKTTFGITVIRSSRMPEYMALLLEHEKAGALVLRRDVTVEPYERPECNKYGFVASVRYGFDSLSECAITLISDC
jgi:hypothetical protein